MKHYMEPPATMVVTRTTKWLNAAVHYPIYQYLLEEILTNRGYIYEAIAVIE